MDTVTDEVTEFVLGRQPDADGWKIDFRYNPLEERFELDDDVNVRTVHNRYNRINLARQNPQQMAEPNEALQGPLVDINEETRYCVAIPVTATDENWYPW